MATIGEITQAAGYTGNKELGGYIDSAIELDTKPIQQLMAYTVMQNKSLWEQRVKDADDKVKQLAEISKYDITNARGKDKELAIQEMAKLQTYAAEYARKGVPKSPQEKIKQEVELQQKIKESTDIIKSLNGRGIGYQAQLDAINKKESNAAVKEAKIRRLNEKFDTTGWDTPIPALEEYSATLPKLPGAAYTTNTTSVDTGNEIVQQTVTLFNMRKTMDAAVAAVSGIKSQLTLPADATPQQRAEFELRMASGDEVTTFISAAEKMNTALSQADKKADGTIDMEALKSSNSMAYETLRLVERSNEYAAQMEADINNGVYVTKLGKKVNLANVVRKDDVFKIDPNKPLTAEQLAYLDAFSKAAPDTKTEKVDFTGEGQKQQDISRNWFEAQTGRMNAQTARINANKPAASGGSGTSPSGSDQTALLFGDHVNTLKNMFANGAQVVRVPYEKTDEITRTALGLKMGEEVTYLPNGTAMVGSTGGRGGRPLTIEQQKSNFIVAVKGGSKDDTSLDATFIEDQENGLRSTLGTTSGKEIWNNWGTPQAAPAKVPGKSSAPVMSDDDYQQFLKKNGLK